jgi:hypothetical protein
MGRRGDSAPRAGIRRVAEKETPIPKVKSNTQRIMSLEEKTKIPRRSFLKKGLITLGSIALAGYIGLGTGCKKHDDPIIPPGPVTLQFDVYNHTQGYRSQFSKTVLSESQLIIKVNELGVSDVDPQRIAVRQDNFGKLEAFSSAGEAVFTAPKQNMNYDIILFNQLGTDSLGRQVSYSWMDEQNSKLYLGKRNYIVYRKDRDGVTGPEDVWESVFDQLNSALDLGWVNWGYVNRQPSATSGDFSYGYGICIVNGMRGDGLHGGSFILVDPEMNHNSPVGMTAVGLSEAFENICSVNNIGGNPSSMAIQKWGVLNQTGKDLFAYAFATDSASK